VSRASVVAGCRIQAVDSSLGDAAEKCDETLSNEVMMQLSSSLELTVCELAACKDCCDEAQNQLTKLSGMPTEELSEKTRKHTLNVMNADGCIMLIDR